MYDLQLQSPFMARLPPEIRLYIYRYCGYYYMINSAKNIEFVFHQAWFVRSRWPRVSAFPSLLGTCRRIAEEAQSIVYESALLCIVTSFFNEPSVAYRCFMYPKSFIPAIGTWNPAMVHELYIGCVS